MKKFILFISFCSVYFSGTSQGYKSVFGHDTTQWNIRFEIPDYAHTLIYRAYHDTLINSKNYKQVYECTDGSNCKDLNKVGYLREDTTIGKLWFLYISGEERLIMDLAINQNDTFVVDENTEYIVDTTYIIDAAKSIIFDSGLNYSDTLKFIESIGPNNMFYWLNNWLDQETCTLLCSYKDNIQVYKNFNNSDCFVEWTSVKSHNKNEELLIYPNPNNGSFKIMDKTQNITITSIKIINVFGAIVKTIQPVSIGQNVDIYDLKPGIYLIYLTTSTSIIYRTIIKENNK